MGRATIARVAALLDDLSPLPRGAIYNCPMDDGESYQLTFQRTPGDTEIAQAEVPASGCLFVTITIPGRGGHTYNGALAGSGAELQSLLDGLTKATELRRHRTRPSGVPETIARVPAST